MNVVIPAAGMGSRFVTAGYTIPKPFLPIKGRPMLDWVIDNISTPDDKVYVLMRSADLHHIQGTSLAYRSGVAFIPVDRPTEGAACTVLLAEQFINSDEPLLIANSDQYMVYNHKDWHRFISTSESVIMTFESSDPKWSYAAVDKNGRVIKVAEKQVISKHATCGVYYFHKGSLFCRAAQSMMEKGIRVKGEFYVCPVFNEITESHNILGFDVDEMYGLGTPEDFQANMDKVGM